MRELNTRIQKILTSSGVVVKDLEVTSGETIVAVFSDCGPIQVTVDTGLTSEESNFRPDNPITNLDNTSATGHVLARHSTIAGDPQPIVTVSFLNLNAGTGKVAITAVNRKSETVPPVSIEVLLPDLGAGIALTVVLYA